MREELKSGNNSIFSRTLIQEMDKSLREKEQIILFLNRRGMATLVQCRNCNFIPGCPRCSVALTYHSGRKLLCHRCHYNIVLPPLCPQCFRTRWKFLGVGTETIEDEVKRLFPQSNPVRWDRDTTTSSHAHAQILNSFRSRHADVLIGTQMIAKGLDLPEVTLAAIINADVGLNTPDFRASERTFQLICQVAGRAGRGNSPGRVIVQSYSPEHYAIRLASSYDYAAFYEHEITYRREFNYPPFSNFIRLTYSHTNIKKCQDEAERMVRVLKETRDRHGMADIEFIGPTPAGIMRLRGRYRWQIIIRGGRLDELLSNLPFPRGWIVDVDPLGMI